MRLCMTIATASRGTGSGTMRHHRFGVLIEISDERVIGSNNAGDIVCCMWIFSLDGMLSIVRHREREDEFLVRSRARGILERRFPNYPILVDDSADYRYRVFVGRTELLTELMSELDSLLKVGYTNFKGECQKWGDPEYNRALGSVWMSMHQYQEELDRS